MPAAKVCLFFEILSYNPYENHSAHLIILATLVTIKNLSTLTTPEKDSSVQLYVPPLYKLYTNSSKLLLHVGLVSTDKYKHKLVIIIPYKYSSYITGENLETLKKVEKQSNVVIRVEQLTPTASMTAGRVRVNEVLGVVEISTSRSAPSVYTTTASNKPNKPKQPSQAS